MKKNLMRILPGLLALILDQFSKALTRQHLPDEGPITLIPGILGLRYAENTGAAFSFLAAHPQILTVLTALLVAGVAIWLWRDTSLRPAGCIGLSLIAGGGLGNLIDRVFFGYVTDFIEVLFMEFAIFNIADCAICIGAGLCMISLLGKEQS